MPSEATGHLRGQDDDSDDSEDEYGSEDEDSGDWTDEDGYEHDKDMDIKYMDDDRYLPIEEWLHEQESEDVLI